MAFAQLFRFVFILYCIPVGFLLLWLPWTGWWDHTVALLPVSELRMLSAPALRGAFSGFGLVHLVWGAHDFSAFLRLPHDEGTQTPGDQ